MRYANTKRSNAEKRVMENKKKTKNSCKTNGRAAIANASFSRIFTIVHFVRLLPLPFNQDSRYLYIRTHTGTQVWNYKRNEMREMHGSSFTGCGMFCWLHFSLIFLPRVPHTHTHTRFDRRARCQQKCMCNLTDSARLLSRLTHVMPVKWDASVYFHSFCRLLRSISAIHALRFTALFLFFFSSANFILPVNIEGICGSFACCVCFFFFVVVRKRGRQLKSIICFKLRLLVDCYWVSSLLWLRLLLTAWRR